MLEVVGRRCAEPRCQLRAPALRQLVGVDPQLQPEARGAAVKIRSDSARVESAPASQKTSQYSASFAPRLAAASRG